MYILGSENFVCCFEILVSLRLLVMVIRLQVDSKSFGTMLFVVVTYSQKTSKCVNNAFQNCSTMCKREE